MRSAEMYLIAAEALAREGRLEEAVNPLNTLRNARGLADYDLAGKTQERLVDDILLERRRELWGEGFGITDILRTQRSVERMPLTKEEAEKTYDCWQQGDTYREYNPEGHWLLPFPTERSLCRTVCIICMPFRKRRRMRILIYRRGVLGSD